MDSNKLTRTQNIRAGVLALIIACTLFLLGQLWIGLHNENEKLNERFRLSTLASATSKSIEQHLASNLMVTRMLEVQVRLNGGSREGFNRYAPEILATSPGVSNIQLAPDGVITDIYPLAGNERAIGHDILKDDRRRDEARKAISTRKTTLAGPFELIQGGIAVIGRQPVFINNGRQDIFWGFTSALIRLDELLKVARFQDLENQGYAFELSHKTPGAGTIKQIKSSGEALGKHWHEETIQVPNGVWTLRIGLPEATNPQNTLLLTSLMTILALAIFLASFYLLRQPAYRYRQIRDLQKQIEQYSLQDSLTGMSNRQSLLQELEQLQVETNPDTSLAALMVINLDNFRAINEHLGSAKGDELLSLVGKRIKALTRDSDLAARIGGDEFAVLIRNISSQDDAAMVADKLQHSISLPVAGLSDLYPVTASIGITLIHPKDASPNQALHNADQAMRLARQNGKARYYIALSQADNARSAEPERSNNNDLVSDEDSSFNALTDKDNADNDSTKNNRISP